MENTENITGKKQVQIKAYSNKELCVLYRAHRKTLKRWLAPYEAEIGRRIGNIYTPKQVERIFKKLGVPGQNQVVLFTQEQESKTENSESEISAEENAAQYVDAAWDFAHAVLWSGKSFSGEELACVRKSMLEYFTFPSKSGEKVSMKKRLSVFCQRILITRLYIDFKPCLRFVPNPALWFDKEYKYGFNYTAKWLKRNQESIELNPFHQEEIKMVAAFYQQYMESRSLSVATKAAEYLVKRSYASLIRIFCPAISEIHAKQNFSNAA